METTLNMGMRTPSRFGISGWDIEWAYSYSNGISGCCTESGSPSCER